MGVLSLGCSIMPVLDASIATLLACGMPSFLPAVIAHGISQGEHGIHVGALPSPAAAFEASLNHELGGALHHARTAWPARSLKERIVHQSEPFAHIAHMLANLFLIDFTLRQAVCHPSEGTWTAMFEDM